MPRINSQKGDANPISSRSKKVVLRVQEQCGSYNYEKFEEEGQSEEPSCYSPGWKSGADATAMRSYESTSHCFSRISSVSVSLSRAVHHCHRGRLEIFQFARRYCRKCLSCAVINFLIAKRVAIFGRIEFLVLWTFVYFINYFVLTRRKARLGLFFESRHWRLVNNRQS